MRYSHPYYSHDRRDLHCHVDKWLLRMTILEYKVVTTPLEGEVDQTKWWP